MMKEREEGDCTLTLLWNLRLERKEGKGRKTIVGAACSQDKSSNDLYSRCAFLKDAYWPFICLSAANGSEFWPGSLEACEKT